MQKWMLLPDYDWRAVWPPASTTSICRLGLQCNDSAGSLECVTSKRFLCSLVDTKLSQSTDADRALNANDLVSQPAQGRLQSAWTPLWSRCGPIVIGIDVLNELHTQCKLHKWRTIWGNLISGGANDTKLCKEKPGWYKEISYQMQTNLQYCTHGLHAVISGAKHEASPGFYTNL